MRRKVFTTKAINRAKLLKRQGASNEEIAAAIGSTPGSVRKQLSVSGAHRERTDHGYLGAFVGGEVEEAIKREAAKRRKSATALVRDILKAIVLENLFTAVLED